MNKINTVVGFIDANEVLATKYEDFFGESLWQLPIFEIENAITELSAKTKKSFNTIMRNCINDSILQSTPFIKTLEKFVSKKSVEFESQNILQQYFKEINNIYVKNNNNYDIEFCEENREKILCMNLKSVISIAKCFQNLGVPLEDLISAGNEGLCHAFIKYKPEQAKLKDNILLAVNDLPNTVEYTVLYDFINKYFVYGKTLKELFDSYFKKGKTYEKTEIIEWVKTNVKNAKFNSVACKWIKAYIIQEINNNSRVVKKSKNDIDKDKQEFGVYLREQIVSFNDPISNKEKTKRVEDTIIADDIYINDSIENIENYKIFKDCLNLLLTGVKSRNRRILLKKFGIGTVRPINPNEIAAQENLSVARISQIITDTIDKMVENAKKYKDRIDTNLLFDIINRLV